MSVSTTLSCGAYTATLIRPMGASRPQGPRRIVVASGGIGSEKSSVTRVLAFLGAVTTDADTITREILGPGEPALSKTTRIFGGDLLRQDGSLDCVFLTSRVFRGKGADERVARLNAITRPLIEVRAWPILHGTLRGSLAIYDIPLLIEGGRVDRSDTAVTVDTPIEERTERLEGREFTPEDARARIRAQASPQERRATAMIWINNEGNSSNLEEIACLVYER